MFDVERILAIEDLEPNHVQCGISGDNRAALEKRGFIRSDGTKAKDYMIRTIQKTAKNKEKAIIKGDKNLGNEVKPSTTTIADKVKKLLEIKTENYRLKEHYNPQVSAQYAVDSVMSMIKNSSPESQHAMLDMETEDALTSRSNLLKSKPETKLTSTAKELNAAIATKASKAIKGIKGGKVIKGKSPDARSKRPRRDEVILKAQTRKLQELNDKFGDLLDDNPRKGHGGTPNITDNSKGRQMMRVQEKHEERLRSLNRQIKEQEDKISKTEWRMDRNTSQTKRSEKFTKKNPIHKGLVDLALEGKLSQWERNPHTFFVKGLNKVALVTFGGEIAPTSKFPAKTKEDWEVVNKIVDSINKRNYKNPLIDG